MCGLFFASFLQGLEKIREDVVTIAREIGIKFKTLGPASLLFAATNK